MARRRALRLSTRVTLFFGAMAMLGGIGLTVATFLFARNSLVDQQINAARITAQEHADFINDTLDLSPSGVSDAMLEIDHDPGGYAIVLDSRFFPAMRGAKAGARLVRLRHRQRGIARAQAQDGSLVKSFGHMPDLP